MSDDREPPIAHEPDEAFVTSLSTDAGGKPGNPVDTSVGSGPESGRKAASESTNGGQPVDNPAQPDLAQSALADARSLSRTIPTRRDRDARRQIRRDNLAGRNKGGYSGPGPDLVRDPQPIGPILAGYVQERGWDRPLAEAELEVVAVRAHKVHPALELGRP